MDSQEKSFDLVQDSAKLLISLATGFLAFTVTFSKELDGFKLGTCWDQTTWVLTWITMLASVGCGVWVLLGLVTELAPQDPSDDHSPSIRSSKIKMPFAIQIVAFGIAVVCMVLFGLGKIFQ